MGKFLRDHEGNPVAIDGGLVLEKTLDRKPRDCEGCGFSKWVKNDKIFMLQKDSSSGNSSNNITSGSQGGGHADASGGTTLHGNMEWICPDCAVQRGLPPQHYHKNYYSQGNAEALRIQAVRAEKQRVAAETAKRGGEGEQQGLMFCGALDGFVCHYF